MTARRFPSPSWYVEEMDQYWPALDTADTRGVDWIGLSLCLRYPDTSRIRVRLTEVICRSVRFAVGERVLGVPK